MLSLGLANNDPVSLWPDEMGNAPATQSDPALRPVWQESIAVLGGRPGVVTPALASSVGTSVLTWTAPAGSAPFSVIIITPPANNWINTAFISQPYPQVSARLPWGNRVALMSYAASSGPGLVYGDGTPDYGVRLWRYLYSTASEIQVDGDAGEVSTGGVTNLSTATWNTTPNGSLLLADSAAAASGHTTPVALIGTCQGDIKLHPRWPAFVEWASNHYGLPVA